MLTGESVFSQLMAFFPRYEFNKCVKRYQGDYRVSNFSCRDQFLCMAFAQLTYRESLRDIETCLRALQPKLYHAGFRSMVARNTLANANRQRDWRIYADFAHVLIAHAQEVVPSRRHRLQVRANRLRFRFHDHRSLFVVVSVGQVSPPQRRGQAAHADRFTRQYPVFYSLFHGKSPRCQRPRLFDAGARRVLHDGSRLRRLRAAVSFYGRDGVLRHARQIQHEIQAARNAPRGQVHRSAERLSNRAQRSAGRSWIIPCRCVASPITMSNTKSGWCF